LDNFVETGLTIILLAGTDTDSYTRRVFATIGKLQLV